MDQNNMMGMGWFNQNPGGYSAYTGVAPQAVVKNENPLTAEEIESLMKSQSQFTISLTKEEVLRGICNHRSPDGTRDMLVDDPNSPGVMECQICHHRFTPIDYNTTYGEISNQVQNLVNIMQTIKLLYVDLPKDAARDFFQIIGLLYKLPQLFEFAAKNFMKHDLNGWQFRNANPNAYNMFQNFMNMFGQGNMMGAVQPQMNPMGGQPMMGQPMGGQPMGQPMGMGQPMNMGMPNQQMGMGQPMGMPQPQSNGFMYTGAVQQPNVYQPGNTGFQYEPTQKTEPAQPTTAPVSPVEDVVVREVKA